MSYASEEGGLGGACVPEGEVVGFVVVADEVFPLGALGQGGGAAAHGGELGSGGCGYLAHALADSFNDVEVVEVGAVDDFDAVGKPGSVSEGGVDPLAKAGKSRAG